MYEKVLAIRIRTLKRVNTLRGFDSVVSGRSVLDISLY